MCAIVIHTSCLICALALQATLREMNLEINTPYRETEELVEKMTATIQERNRQQVIKEL